MAYKNVNKRIHKLLSLNVIQETEADNNDVNKHKAKYYNLTEYGIYQLFLNKLDKLSIRQLDTIKFGKPPSSNTLVFLRNYDNSLLFKSFLYPYFEKDTLFEIGNFLLLNLFQYLAVSCHKIKDQFKYESYNIPVIDTIFCWNKVPGENNEVANLSQFLKELFNLQDVRYIKKDPNDNYTIKVETSSASIKIKLDRDRKKVEIMSTASGKLEKFEYDIFEMNSDILVGSRKPTKEYRKIY
jgi:hypothetical protein